MRKNDIESTMSQNEQVLSIFILIFLNHSLQASVLCNMLYWTICTTLYTTTVCAIYRQIINKE